MVKRRATGTFAAAAAAGRSRSWPSAGPGRIRRGPDLEIPARAKREQGLSEVYADVVRRREQHHDGPVDTYRMTMPVAGYDDKQVTVEIDWRNPGNPRVFVDGPTDSPHRHACRRWHRLCIWHPSDPPSLRWVPEDGMVALLGMIAVHLFKEAWWRETREWLGDEAGHPLTEEEAA